MFEIKITVGKNNEVDTQIKRQGEMSATIMLMALEALIDGIDKALFDNQVKLTEELFREWLIRKKDGKCGTIINHISTIEKTEITGDNE